jgi:hypothetical protein
MWGLYLILVIPIGSRYLKKIKNPRTNESGYFKNFKEWAKTLQFKLEI